MAEKLASGHLVKNFEGEEAEALMKRFFLYSGGVIKLHPDGWTYMTTFKNFANGIFNFEERPTDIFIVTFPKSGTTWTQEIIWNLVHNPNLDNPDANLQIDERFPNLDLDMYLAVPGAPQYLEDGNIKTLINESGCEINPSKGTFIELSIQRPDPRMMKTHLSLPLMPQKMIENSRVVYVARDPRDVITSLYHFARLHTIWDFTGTLDEFIDDFIEDRILYGPYWRHMKIAWEMRNHPNLCFLFYEDLKNDIVSQVKRIDKFLGTNRSNKQIENIVQFTSFSQMKERAKDNPPTSNHHEYFDKKVVREEGGFFRKGVVGDWKNRFSPEQMKKINAWMAKNLPQFGEDFKYKV